MSLNAPHGACKNVRGVHVAQKRIAHNAIEAISRCIEGGVLECIVASCDIDVSVVFGDRHDLNDGQVQRVYRIVETTASI